MGAKRSLFVVEGKSDGGGPPRDSSPKTTWGSYEREKWGELENPPGGKGNEKAGIRTGPKHKFRLPAQGFHL